MKILFLLIPLSIMLLGLAVWAFFWAVRSGQFDDLDSPAYRILLDDDDTARNGEDLPGDDERRGESRANRKD